MLLNNQKKLFVWTRFYNIEQQKLYKIQYKTNRKHNLCYLTRNKIIKKLLYIINSITRLGNGYISYMNKYGRIKKQ